MQHITIQTSFPAKPRYMVAAQHVWSAPPDIERRNQLGSRHKPLDFKGYRYMLMISCELEGVWHYHQLR